MTAAAISSPATLPPPARTSAPALRIAIILVHYKTPQMLADCVASLFPELDTSTGHPDHIFIVDNASGSHAIAALAALQSHPAITLLESPINLGFAGANNLAIERIGQEGGADFYLLLNPDTLIRPNAIATLLHFLETHPSAACVGPRLEDPDATPQQSAFSSPTPLSEFLRGASIGPLSKLLQRWQVYGAIHHCAQPTDWLAGACILMRSSMVETAGLLDDRFFMYFEEVDFFRRAKALNLQAWYEPAAHVVHLVGQSSGVTITPGQKRLPAYWFESRHHYFRKYFGYRGMLAADALWLLGHILDRTRKLFTGTSHAPVAKSEAKDLLRHCLHQLLHPRATQSPRAQKGAA